MGNVSPLHVLIAVALAVPTVALQMGLVRMAIPWIVAVYVAWGHESQHGRGGITLATYATVTAVIVVAAILAPVKTTEQVLDRPLALPKTELTLAEMDPDANYESTRWLPRYIHVATDSDSAAKPIRFRAKDITLREFVETIEAQSTLRHRFWHCGNGYSILFGGDCCFGLSLHKE